MSREFFKSITYRNNKVFTRQCSSNVWPKHYYSNEHLGFTKIYNKYGKVGFEKWFIINCLMTGNAVILNGCNKTLEKLKKISESLYDNNYFLSLRNKKEVLYNDLLLSKSDDEKDKINKKYQKVIRDVESYISDFYDKQNIDYKNKIRSDER